MSSRKHKSSPDRLQEHDLVEKLQAHLKALEERAHRTQIEIALIGAIATVLAAFFGHEQPKAPAPPIQIIEPAERTVPGLSTPRVEPKAGSSPEMNDLVLHLSSSSVGRDAFAESVRYHVLNGAVDWETQKVSSAFVLANPEESEDFRALNALYLGALGAKDKTPELLTLANQAGIVGEAASVAIRMLDDERVPRIPTLQP